MPGFFHLIAGHALVALAVAMFAVGSKPATCSAELPAGLIVHLDAADADPDPVAGLGGHYVLNVKGNQGALRDGIEKVFAEYLDGKMPTTPVRHRHSTNKGHGPRESRWRCVCSVPHGLPDSDRWPELKAIGMVISKTESDGMECVNIRYSILSRQMPVKKFAAIVKGRWAIESELHWQLDGTAREDHCRIRKGNADANFSILRRIALMLLKNEKTAKLGVKHKQLSARWDDDYLLKGLVSICDMVQSPWRRPSPSPKTKSSPASTSPTSTSWPLSSSPGTRPSFGLAERPSRRPPQQNLWVTSGSGKRPIA